MSASTSFSPTTKSLSPAAKSLVALRFAIGLACGAIGLGCAQHGPPWEQIPTDGVPARWGHVAVSDDQHDRMLVFGGENADGQRNDVWSLDLDSQRWTEIETKDAPGPRTDLASVLDLSHGRWLMIGGRVDLATSIDEVWSLDLDTLEWSQLPPGPPARHDIPAATDGKRAWVFGGAGALFQSLDDLWQLDLGTGEWREMPNDGPHPTARTSCALTYWKGSIYMHGGHDVAQVFRDTWRYDLATEQWSRLDVEGAAAANAHFGHALDPSCGAMMLAGGDNLDNDVVSVSEALTLGDDPRFVRVPASSLPPPRDHCTLVVDAKRRDMVLYGGGALGDGLDTFGDAWLLPLGACP